MTPPPPASPAHPTLEAVAPPPAANAPAAPAGKKKLLVVLAAIVAAGAGLFGAHALLTAGEQSTDDAQVEADVVPIAPRVAGMIAHVRVRENQLVQKGDVVAEIDDADFSVRVRQAEAELETARAQASASGAQIASADATLKRATAESGKAKLDLERAEKLRAGDAIAPERLDAARTTGDTAHATLTGATAQVASARAQAELARARVKSAEAALDLARLQLGYTRILAPADGEVSKVGVREGQLVSAGQPLAQLVPTATYLVANFKETQVGAMKPGQRATVEVDAFPGQKLEGTVESISGGTGARFSLLPPDNASGNFVKVVERVPVRIAWSKPPPSGLALRAGLSAGVTVDTR